LFNDPFCIKIEELIDELYERKKEGERLQHYQPFIASLLTEYLRNPK
jgi:hypothetical protein